jgi:hypothetical protein
MAPAAWKRPRTEHADRGVNGLRGLACLSLGSAGNDLSRLDWQLPRLHQKGAAVWIRHHD